MSKLIKLILSITIINLFICGNALAQKKSMGTLSPTITTREASNDSDPWLPLTVDELGTPFDGRDYEQVRVYITISDNTTSCTIRPMIWNDAVRTCVTDTPLYRKTSWQVDTPNVKTGVKNGYSFLYEHRYAPYVQMLVDTISGDGEITIQMQGSNVTERR